MNWNAKKKIICILIILEILFIVPFFIAFDGFIQMNEKEYFITPDGTKRKSDSYFHVYLLWLLISPIIMIIILYKGLTELEMINMKNHK